MLAEEEEEMDALRLPSNVLGGAQGPVCAPLCPSSVPMGTGAGDS